MGGDGGAKRTKKELSGESAYKKLGRFAARTSGLVTSFGVKGLRNR